MRKPKAVAILCLLVTLLFTMCKPDCEYESSPEIEPCGKNETCGDIIDIVDIYKSALIYNSEYIITNDSLYNELKKLDTVNGISWPDVNFEDEMLIGKYTESTGCSGNSTYKLTIVNSEYVLSIRNISHGNCDKLMMKTHWLIIPRIDSSNLIIQVIENEC